MLQVLKFGGSSVADATAVSRVLDIVAGAEGRVVLISSAIKGCTDELIEIASLVGSKGGSKPEVKDADDAAALFAEKIATLKKRHLNIIRRLFTGAERADAENECHALFAEMASAPADEIPGFGEIFSTRIIARKLACDGVFTKWLDSRILIVKDHKELTYNNIQTAVALEPQVSVFVAPGFVASTYEGKRTTLGRGGSDLSASIFAAALNADSLQIWTDVPGIMSGNPKDVPSAETISEISYRAALDMASHGAKVLYAPAVQPAMEAGIAINIRNTFNPSDPGTTVRDVALKGWAGVASAPGSAEGTAQICLVAEGGTESEAAVARANDALLKAGIKAIESVAEGPNVLLKVRQAVEKQALGALHREFFESSPRKVINLYLAGYGKVGMAFVQMLAERGAKISAGSGKILRLAGLSDSRRYILDINGLDLNTLDESLGKGQEGDFAAAVMRSAPRHSIFLDLTDSESIYRSFVGLLRAGINIICSNRRSLSVPYADYAAIMAAAAENGCFVRYETTVGSALPLLDGISRSANAGEEILEIEAVVSCTLNKILSSYARYPGSFAQTVRKAQEEGLTEADPRQDLLGKDALRKLLILAREAGVPLEEADVQIVPAIPEELTALPLDEFYRKLEEMEPVFDAAEKAAARSQCRQRFIASLKKDVSVPLGYKAVIGIRNVPRNHPAFRILGTENAVIVRSAYHPYPLVIQGAGEGAQMAAGSIMNEILK